MGNAFRTRMKSSGKKGDRLLANRSIAAAGRLNTDTETRSSSAGNRTPWAMFPCLGQVGHGDACFAYFNKIWGIPEGMGGFDWVREVIISSHER